MKIPKLQKRYKVIWEYYYNDIRRTTKTYENVTKEMALAWVKALIGRPITFSISVTDYEGHWQLFKPTTSEVWYKQRRKFLQSVVETMGDEAEKFLKTIGDSSISNAPLGIQASIDFLKDKRTMDKYIDLLLSGEATDTALYVVAGIPVSKVIARCAALAKEDWFAVKPLPKLSDYQIRLLKSCKLWHKYIDKEVPKNVIEESDKQCENQKFKC